MPSDWHSILSDPQVKMVFIASNPASHAEYAIACIEAGKNVHIEKPHVTTAYSGPNQTTIPIQTRPAVQSKADHRSGPNQTSVPGQTIPLGFGHSA